MNKSDLIQTMSEELKIPVIMASGIVDTLIESIAETLVKGENVEIRGFGSFTVKKYKSYTGRNPKTGEETLVKPKKLPFFKVGKELKEAVNAGKK
jgi:integration host factor subunit beta